MASKTRFGPQYEWTCKRLRQLLQDKKEKLWDDVWITKNNFYEVHREVPQKNWEEAVKRVRFVEQVLKKYRKMLYSNMKVYVFVHTLNERLAKLQARQAQVRMDFMAEDQSSEREEISEIIRIKKMIKTLNAQVDYFEEMYY